MSAMEAMGAWGTRRYEFHITICGMESGNGLKSHQPMEQYGISDVTDVVINPRGPHCLGIRRRER